MSDISLPLRFVVLYHEGIAEPHFDLMFEMESGGELATWRSAHWPPEIGENLIRIGDHRREYLDYEGDLSKQRGRVRRVARGTYRRVESATHWLITFIEPALAGVQLPVRSG